MRVGSRNNGRRDRSAEDQAGYDYVASQASWRRRAPSHALSNAAIGRLAGWVYLGGGLTGLAALALTSSYPGGVSRVLLVEVCITGATIGALSAWVLPWERWPRGATLVLVVFGLALLALANVVIGDWMPTFYGVFYMVIFGWLGLSQGRWSAALWSPAVAVAYLLPPWLDGSPPEGDALSGFMLSALVSLPAGVLLGELIAWVSDELRQAELSDARRLKGMGALLEASTTLAYQLDEAASSDVVAKLAGELLSGDAAIVFVLPDSGRLEAAGAWPLESPELVLELDGAFGHVVGPILAEQGVAELAWGPSVEVNELLDGFGARSAVAMALRGATEPIGLVLVLRDGRSSWLDAFTEDLARAFALQAGLALERAWQARSLLDASMRDELTGLGNRRSAMLLLSQAAPGDIIGMLDLDHFKEVNDTLGHAVGDDLLRDLGEYLDEAIRGSDHVARYGGEEFVILLRGAGGRAKSTFERLLEGWRVRLPEATFSVGYAVHQQGRTSSATLKMADRALYQAKEAGRDRACALEEPEAGGKRSGRGASSQVA